MPASPFPTRRPWLALAALFIAMSLLAGLPSPTLAQAAASTAEVGRVRITVEPGAGVDAAAIASAHGPAMTEAWPQFAALFGAEPTAPQFIAFVNQVDPAGIAGMRWVSDFAWVSPDGTVAVIVTGPFLALTPIEATNLLRNITSRGFIQAAAGNAMPLGLLDGLARYVETPVLARQARLGSLVQGQHQAGTLPGWEQIASATVSGLSPETQTANAYALVAFFTERYGIAGLRELVAAFNATPRWSDALATAFGQSEAELATAWSQFLPRWFATGWRDNAVSAFDLSRAESLFGRGAYEAAIAEAERSQRLFSDLNDQAGLSKVEALLAQCAIGLQADTIMADAQAALENHEYARALATLAQAETLYALLPPEHRPAALIDRYTLLANQGTDADHRLAEARTEAGSLLNVTSARKDAVAAGDAYALLGNTPGVEAAQSVVGGIDRRIQRMLLVLSALVIVLGAWLAMWLWQRSPARLHWLRQAQPARAARTGGD